MATKVLTVETGPAYRDDLAAWALHQIELLNAGRFAELDIENLVDEVGDLAKREFHVLTSALTIVLVLMVKWDFQPWERTASWYFSILEHRRRIERQIADNPSFRPRLAEALAEVWPSVVPQVLLQTHMDRREFPTDCPYDWDEILNRTFIWPQP